MDYHQHPHKINIPSMVKHQNIQGTISRVWIPSFLNIDGTRIGRISTSGS